MTGKATVATLGALASVATILTFLITVGNSSSTTSQPQLGPITPVSSTNLVSPSNQVSPVNPTGSAIPASAENAFLSACEQSSGYSAPHCQCDINWLQANDPYSTTSSYWTLVAVSPQDSVTEAEQNANCPPS